MNATMSESDLADANAPIAEGAGRYFRLTSAWVLEAQMAEVAEILAEPESITRWWPSSFLRAELVHPGSDGHHGKTIRLHSKGLLPHTFQFILRVNSFRYPEFIYFAVKGDFEGEARAIARRQKEGRIVLFFDWRVTVHHPWIRYFVPVARRLFIMNHRWSMKCGERALRREILRRRGAFSAECGSAFQSSPSFPHNMAFVRRLYGWRSAISDGGE